MHTSCESKKDAEREREKWRRRYTLATLIFNDVGYCTANDYIEFVTHFVFMRYCAKGDGIKLYGTRESMKYTFGVIHAYAHIYTHSHASG